MAQTNKRSYTRQKRASGTKPSTIAAIKTYGAIAPLSTYCLRLLGVLQIEHNGSVLDRLYSRKALALFSYLIVSNTTSSRAKLADWFWPNVPKPQALRYLSQALSQIERLFPGSLKANAQTVCFQPTEGIWIDVSAFHTLVAQATIASLIEAVALYRGTFLESFYLDGCAEFELWLLREREQWQQQLVMLLERLILHYRQLGEYRQALHFTDRLLQLEPCHEETHRHRMILLAALGQRTDALSQYLLCCRVLAEELGIEPSEEITNLYQQIRDGNIAVPRQALPLSGPVKPLRPRSWQHCVPSDFAFFGRVHELAQLTIYLRTPGIRLITIVGPGGIGKTRLALQLALQHQKLFPHGVAVTFLEAATSSQAIVFEIAEALGVILTDTGDPSAQLIHILANQQLLLILDNFDHLLEAHPLLLDLLASAPELTIIVTSRERLNLQCEYLCLLEGLPVPDALSDDQSIYTPAVQLFTDRAHQQDHWFCLTDANRSSVIQICRTLAGNPLGIELAAAWMKQLSVQQIAAALDNNIDVLSSTMPDLPKRHDSIRAVFEGSWRLLTSIEQRSFVYLAIFQGEFDQEAATAIAGTTIWLLTALAYKSLLRSRVPGRYMIHELVRQYALEASTTAEYAADILPIRDRHSRFYLGKLADLTPSLYGPQPRQAADIVLADLINIRQAWHWALQRRFFAELSASLCGFSRLYQITGFFHEAAELLDHAAAVMKRWCRSESSAPSDMCYLLGQIQSEQVLFLIRLARYDDALPLLSEAADLAHQTQAVDLEVAITSLWANLLFHQGQYDMAEQYNNRALELAQPKALYQLQAYNRVVQGNIAIRRGNYAYAWWSIEQAIQIYQAMHDRLGIAITLNSLGVISWHQGKYAVAQHYYERYLGHCRELGNTHLIGSALHNLADALWPQGAYQQARQIFEQALQIHREIGDRWNISITLVNLGILLLAIGDLHTAAIYSEEGLHLASELGGRWIESLALITLGALAYRQGNDVLACSYARLGLASAQAHAGRDEQSWALTCLGHALRRMGQWDEAADAYQQALELRYRLEPPHRTSDILAGLADLALSRGKLDQAREYVELILQDLSWHPVVPIYESGQIYRVCYMVLHASQDLRAPAIHDKLLQLKFP